MHHFAIHQSLAKMTKPWSATEYITINVNEGREIKEWSQNRGFPAHKSRGRINRKERHGLWRKWKQTVIFSLLLLILYNLQILWPILIQVSVSARSKHFPKQYPWLNNIADCPINGCLSEKSNLDKISWCTKLQTNPLGSHRPALPTTLPSFIKTSLNGLLLTFTELSNHWRSGYLLIAVSLYYSMSWMSE